ncbi:MAG: hypothetical protein KJN79_00575 [Gammaproteobacteria bacterium]|nr:hypothetical protein [Gammaproteobacteria bacterium]
MAEGRKTNRAGEALSGIKAQAGQRFFSFKKTLTADPLAVLFADEGLPDMDDVAYRVFIHGETDVGNVDESTIATTGFSILGGTGAEVAHILVHGAVAE